MKFRIFIKNESRYSINEDRFYLDINGKLNFYIYDILSPIDEINNLVPPKYIPNKLDINNLVIEYCTGLKDKNEKEIYEGDILKLKFHEIDLMKDVISVVNYLPTDIYYFYNFDKEDIEIIGNIHENPELLKDG